MASGSRTSPGLDFNNTGRPRDAPPCTTAATEQRGPGQLLAGLCCACGRATVTRDAAGLPRHAP